MPETKDPIVIVLACDDRYVRHTAITMVSIVKNSKRYFNFYLLDCGITTENLEKLNLLDLGSNTLQIIKPKLLEIFEKFPLPKRLSPATFYRLLIAEILKNVDKAIYLDSDVVVQGDLGALWDVDLGNNLLGAVENYYYDYFKKYVFHKKNIGLSNDSHYFNAGVLLLNLKELRNYKLLEKSLTYLENHHYSLLKWHDQDLLNIFIDRKRFLALSVCCNFCPSSTFKYYKGSLPDVQICVHHTHYRPWLCPKWATQFFPLKMFRCMYPYYLYAKETPWKKEYKKHAKFYYILLMFVCQTLRCIKRPFRKLYEV